MSLTVQTLVEFKKTEWVSWSVSLDCAHAFSIEVAKGRGGLIPTHPRTPFYVIRIYLLSVRFHVFFHVLLMTFVVLTHVRTIPSSETQGQIVHVNLFILLPFSWLPVSERIKFRILLLTFKALHQRSPTYIQNLTTRYLPSRSLRSSSTLSLNPVSFNLPYDLWI